MNFEKVEIYGFKSFADKAEIKFGNGITAIVGPNGCGKSNVADAIRWVLGEQSAKTLRGSSMQDVIFAGTQGRKSLSYCEVSLYFDNSTHMFSIDYNELIITRKLYRSGESEYFINKQPARLKDIVELLHECGIGKEGYTIIGQGKVEEIMSAKPEDRRMIFEEATGIAKFKSKKNESERKLERTHENVVRYSDILSEIENQLAPLEKQAEKAREFNELSEQLKHHELNTYVAKVEGVESAKEKINTKIKGIDEQTELRRKEFERAEKEYNEIFTSISDADLKLKNLNNELLEKTLSMEKSSSANKLFEQKLSYIQSQIERAENDIKEREKLISANSTQISSNLDQIRQAKKELNEASLLQEKVSTKLKQIVEKIVLSEELEKANQKKVIESLESLTDIKVNKGTMSIERSNLVDKLNELSEKLDALCVKRDGLFNEKDSSDKKITALDKSIFETKNNITSKEDEVRNGNEKVAQIDNKIYQLNSVITSLITKENFYKSLKDNYEGFAPSVRQLMTKTKDNLELKKRVKGVVAEIIKNDKKFDIALETALAASAQNVVTDTPEDAQFLIEYLKRNGIGRITFLPVTSVRRREQTIEVTNALNEVGALGVADKLVSYDKYFDNIISSLLGNTLIVDTMDNATRIAKKYRSAFRIVTLDGEIYGTQGSMTGGARKQDAVSLLSSDRRIEENAKTLAEKNKEMESLKKSKGEEEKIRDKALDDLSILNEMYNSKRQEKLLESEKLSVSEKSLSEIGRDIENTSDLIDEVRNRISAVDKKYEAVSSGSKKLEEDRESAESLKNKHDQEFDALKKERDLLTEQSTSLQVKITEIKAQLTNLDEENVRLDGENKESNEIKQRLIKSNESAEFMIKQIHLDQEKIALTQEQQDILNALRDEINGIETYKTELKSKLAKNEETRKLVSDALNELIDKKNNEKIALTKIDSDLEYMGQSIFEDYGATYETAIKEREENYDANFGEQEINRIRRKRSSLGSINAEAIEDSKALKERFEEMSAQKEDMEKAEQDIQEAIDKIKGEMLTQFDEGFAKINENFQKIFKELFGGGRAMLELDYGDDLVDKLDAGVEIIAEPPGKKLQKLSLLSGGEKALTAIAILFAILRLRPMPFCILDEIEAALDEANVDRFARYLQKFSEDTQFIVITHRKPTMELADSLFGVTMQEKGVSKMVSVKLSDVVNNNELMN